MRILVLAENRKMAKPFVGAFYSKGIHAKYVRLSKVVLVSRNKKTEIRLVGDDIEQYDAVFLQARPSLAPFVEPLIEELINQGFYVNAKPGSYYLAQNQPYLFVTLAMNGIKTPKTITSGSGKNIERLSSKISFPLLAKSFIGKDVQQALIVNNAKELNAFVNSIKNDIDGFMVCEFIESDVVSCIVVGGNIFAIKRKVNDCVCAPLEKGRSYRVSDYDKETILAAAKTCGFDIARLDIVKGRIIAVEPLIEINEFDKVCSELIETYIADFYNEQYPFIKRKTIFSEIKEIKSFFSKSVFGRLFR
jgi:glutathione synthase/RimK-type ligase-like ATP-grasp enzyme